MQIRKNDEFVRRYVGKTPQAQWGEGIPIGFFFNDNSPPIEDYKEATENGLSLHHHIRVFARSDEIRLVKSHSVGL
jgi:hypothetical protein